MTRLSEDEIQARLAELPEWRRDGNEIVRQFDCGDFVGAIRFVNSLVEPAEAMGHHPDIEISWNEVTISLSTHSQGGLTAADFELAARIDALTA